MLRVAILLFISVFLVGCLDQQPDTSIAAPATNITAPQADSGMPAASQDSSNQDLGDFKVVYSPTTNPTYQQFEVAYRESRLFESLAEDLNGAFLLPADITINLTECGTVNAFYDSTKNQIVMCYELVEDFIQLFSSVTSSETELNDATNGAMLFVFYHEIGHALIDVYKLPITGKEEDAVDQLSVLILLNADRDDDVTSGAIWFGIKGAQNTDIEALQFWDAHSLDSQRFYGLLCLVYGKDPQHSNLVEDGALPQSRAAGCQYEYERVNSSWNALLAPYAKQ